MSEGSKPGGFTRVDSIPANAKVPGELKTLIGQLDESLGGLDYINRMLDSFLFSIRGAQPENPEVARALEPVKPESLTNMLIDTRAMADGKISQIKEKLLELDNYF